MNVTNKHSCSICNEAWDTKQEAIDCYNSHKLDDTDKFDIVYECGNCGTVHQLKRLAEVCCSNTDEI